MELLGVAPGSVSPLCAINDGQGAVTIVLDRALLVAERVCCHPLSNDRTTAMAPGDLLRFLRATGLTHKKIQQIERAHEAVSLLEGGSSIADAAFELGYFDQAHLTNSLKRFVGRTPAQISR